MHKIRKKFILVFYGVLVFFSGVSPVLKGLHRTAAHVVHLVCERT